MKIDELKDRLSKVKPRAKKLWETYPVLSSVIAGVFFGLGLLVCWVIGLI